MIPDSLKQKIKLVLSWVTTGLVAFLYFLLRREREKNQSLEGKLVREQDADAREASEANLNQLEQGVTDAEKNADESRRALDSALSRLPKRK